MSGFLDGKQDSVLVLAETASCAMYESFNVMLGHTTPHPEWVLLTTAPYLQALLDSIGGERYPDVVIVHLRQGHAREQVRQDACALMVHHVQTHG
jgi:hypothetical protein